MSSPIEALPDNSELIKTLSHDDIKGFAKEAFAIKSKLRTVFSATVLLAMMVLAVVFGYSLTMAFTTKVWDYCYQLLAGFGACFTIVLVIHELLHGLAYKFYGSKKLYFGASLKPLVFYAASDQEYFNGHQFKVIALLPFIVITALLLIVGLVSPEYLFLVLTVFGLHTIMAQGDFALVLFVKQYPAQKLLTMDSRAKRESYFYLLKSDVQDS